MVRLRSLLFGDFLVSMPYFNYGGPLADPTAAAALVRGAGAIARDLGSGHAEFRCSEELETDCPRRTDKVNMHLPLPATEQELWDGFDAKLRAQVRKPQKAGAAVRTGGEELLADFYAVFSRNMRDLGTPVYGREWFAAILERMPERATIIVVSVAGQPVAAGFLLGFRDTLEIPWASSLREHNRSGANMLLYWEALRFAVARGYRRFDFGRSSLDSGTYRFKEQWGARPAQQHWYYWLPPGRSMPNLTPHNPKYQLATRLWQKLPVAVANRLGPHIVRNLP